MCTKVKHKGYAHIELIFLTNDFKEKKKKKVNVKSLHLMHRINIFSISYITVSLHVIR